MECTEVFDWKTEPLNAFTFYQKDVAAYTREGLFDHKVTAFLCQACTDKVNKKINWKVRLKNISPIFRDLLKTCEDCMEFGKDSWVIYVCTNHRNHLEEEVERQYS